MKTYILILAMSLASCEGRPDQVVDPTTRGMTSSNATTSNPEQELYLSYVFEGGSGTTGGTVIDACYLAGPHEIVALVETLSEPSFEDYESCGSPDDYRASLVRIDAKILRGALGETASQVTGVAMVDLDVGIESRVYSIPVGTTEIWSLRKAGDEWMIVRRLPVSVSTNPNEVPEAHAAVDLPAKWSDLAIELAATQADYDDCPAELVGLAEYREMTPAEFDDWVHHWVPTFGFEDKCN